MARYSLTNKGNVIQCKKDCPGDHEHYEGTYERAVKYFGADTEEIKSYGNLINLVMFHQTSQFTIPKLSNELYDILLSAMAEHKYWVPLNERHDEALKVLAEAAERKYIKDTRICETIEKIGNQKAKSRKYMYEMWMKQNDF